MTRRFSFRFEPRYRRANAPFGVSPERAWVEVSDDQLPRYGSPDRVRLVVYPGGHMFYSRDASRAALRNEAKAMISVD